MSAGRRPQTPPHCGAKIALVVLVAALTGVSGAHASWPEPRVRIQPIYPAEAVESGTQAICLVVHSVRNDGAVVNVEACCHASQRYDEAQVNDAAAASLFEAASARAVGAWRYYARDGAGGAIQHRELLVRIPFQIENGPTDPVYFETPDPDAQTCFGREPALQPWTPDARDQPLNPND